MNLILKFKMINSHAHLQAEQGSLDKNSSIQDYLSLQIIQEV